MREEKGADEQQRKLQERGQRRGGRCSMFDCPCSRRRGKQCNAIKGKNNENTTERRKKKKKKRSDKEVEKTKKAISIKRYSF